MNNNLVEYKVTIKTDGPVYIGNGNMFAKYECVFVNRNVVGITDMEKLMGRKIFKELLGDYIIKPKGRLTLVPETDKREEVHTLGEFRKEF